MIVKCIRCNTEFSSSYSRSHVCPNCHFVFTLADSTRVSPQAGMKIVRSEDLAKQSEEHQLLEEIEDRCSFHPDVEAISHCKRCGRSLCYVCTVETEGVTLCELCSEASKAQENAVAPLEAAAPKAPEKKNVETISGVMAQAPYVAWEHRRHLGWTNALLTTWLQSLFGPLRFFRNVPIAGNYGSPLLYGLFWTLAGLAAGVLWKIILFTYPTIVIFLGGEPIVLSLQLSQAYILAALTVILSPVLGLLILLGAGALYHFFVTAFARDHGGFESTLRVVCYSTGTNIFLLVPILGALIGGIWQLILVTVGLKEVHRISFVSALATALIPYTLLLIATIAFMLWAVSSSGLGMASLLFAFVRSVLGR